MPHTAQMTRLGPASLRMQQAHLGAAATTLTEGRRVTRTPAQIAFNRRSAGNLQ